MKHIFSGVILLFCILLMPHAAMAGCEDFQQACEQYCQTTVCEDSCNKGESFCSRASSNRCETALTQCQDECTVMDTYEAQSNCYAACSKGMTAC